MRNFSKISLLILAALALALPIHAQVTLSQTTLSAAVTSTSQRTIQVASGAAITAPAPPGTTSTQLYIDDEMLDVEAVQGNLIVVRRGVNGTRSRSHVAGANVYILPANLGAAIAYPLGGSCLAGTYPANPMIDYVDSYVFQCVSGQWALQSITGQQHYPNNLFITTAYTNATTTFSNVPGISFPAAANHSYTLSCQLVFQGSAATAGPKFQVTGPSSPTSVSLAVDGGTAAAAYADAAATAFASPVTALGSGTLAIATNLVAHVNLGVINGANAGTVTLQAAANGVGTLTIQPGSFCIQQ